MAMTLPDVPSLNAGYVADSTDMNAMAYAAQFALNKPYSRVHATTTQTITSTTGTPVNYDTIDFDPDGMYSSGNPGRLTVQTPGYYKFRQMCNCGNVGANVYMLVTTGSNNPIGAGNTFTQYSGYVLGTTNGALGGSGILDAYMFPGDYCAVMLLRPAGTMTTVLTDVGSWFSLEWKSM